MSSGGYVTRRRYTFLRLEGVIVLEFQLMKFNSPESVEPTECSAATRYKNLLRCGLTRYGGVNARKDVGISFCLDKYQIIG